ncbi:MAG: ATPase [Ruminococcaceae bacterium]|nr:ATPase [Oscillospiraceae bacterium]
MYLGIEFGSTRIKATVIDSNYITQKSSGYNWQSQYIDDVWTYDLQNAWTGLRSVLEGLGDLSSIEAVGISGMMHGYLVFDKDWNLLAPFRTWQNMITGRAADELTELFNFNIPQRWSIAHLYQAILNNEEHIDKIAHITTLAGYFHYMLTGRNVVGIGEASGIFPVDSINLGYDRQMLSKFDELLKLKKIRWTTTDVLPEILLAGDKAGNLTEQGSNLIDSLISPGVVFAPPEGDAGTGMVATNSVRVRTGNVSAGTSIFSMVVLDRPMKNLHREIDIITTPDGRDVAMVHCNNCTRDSNEWINMLREMFDVFGYSVPDDELYSKLYTKSLEGAADCAGITVCNYIAGENLTHMPGGIPMVIRQPDSKFTFAEFFRATLYSSMATMRIGMEILTGEKVSIDSLTGHGGLFKTPGVGQKYMAAACRTPIVCMESSGEGGPYGMAILASFTMQREENECLADYLDSKVFKDTKTVRMEPDAADVAGFDKYMRRYMKLLDVERKAVDIFSKEKQR